MFPECLVLVTGLVLVFLGFREDCPFSALLGVMLLVLAGVCMAVPLQPTPVSLAP